MQLNYALQIFMDLQLFWYQQEIRFAEGEEREDQAEDQGEGLKGPRLKVAEGAAVREGEG